MREELVSALSKDDGVHPYAKWGGAFWRLESLADLGAPAGHAGAMKAAEQTLGWVASPTRLAEIRKRRIAGRIRRCASQPCRERPADGAGPGRPSRGRTSIDFAT